MEMKLIKGDVIRVTTNDEYKEKCSSEIIYIDYKNITKVVSVGKCVYVDDGLVCLVVEKIGNKFDF